MNLTKFGIGTHFFLTLGLGFLRRPLFLIMIEYLNSNLLHYKCVKFGKKRDLQGFDLSIYGNEFIIGKKNALTFTREAKKNLMIKNVINISKMIKILPLRLCLLLALSAARLVVALHVQRSVFLNEKLL